MNSFFISQNCLEQSFLFNWNDSNFTANNSSRIISKVTSFINICTGSKSDR